MALQNFYPVLMAGDVEASARFYTEFVGFDPNIHTMRTDRGSA